MKQKEIIATIQKRVNSTPDGIIGPNTLAAFRQKYQLNMAQAAHFFGQCSHESGGFRLVEENLNYSAQALRSVFGKYFTTNEEAENYARKPEEIANIVYANRMGNDRPSSGDGWRYRGRGIIQLTGRSNYLDFAEWIGYQSVIVKPEVVATQYPFDVALYYFQRHGLFAKATVLSVPAIREVTRAINGGYNGLKDREHKTNKYYLMQST